MPPGPSRLSSGMVELEVHADVHDHARGAQGLAVQHPEEVGGVVEEAELLHQPLGVERPPLAVPAAPAHQPLPAVERVAAVGRLGDLQVVSGHALVEHGGDLAPGVEVVDAVGHRPPHASRSLEVLGRAGVVDAAVVGRGEHALDPPDRRRDVEVHVGHRGDACGRRGPASTRGTPRGRGPRGSDRRRGGPPRRRRRRRGGSARRWRPSGRTAAAARPSPRRRSRRGRPPRRGSSGSRARRPRVRRPRAPRPAARARR